MTTAEPPIVETVWIDAPPDRVFPFFTDPGRLANWLGQADVDPVPGGRFAVDVKGRQVRGSYVEVQPPHRVVFTWGDAGGAGLPPGSSRVEVDLEPADGGTKVTLMHHGLSGVARAKHAEGWPIELRGLVAAV